MHSNRARFLVALFAALCLLAFAAACSKSADDESDAEGGGDDSAEVANLTPYKPSGQEGSISGTINFSGAAPAPKPISMDADPVCASASPDAHAEDLVVNGDKLQNVLVYIKDGQMGGKSISGFKFDPPAQAATLDQHGCHYVPHVQAVEINQTLNIINSDQTSHNINFDSKLNEKFNQGQGPGAAPIVKQLKRPETVVPVKCNQHPWMRAYVAVLSHPFFAITDKDGHFEIKGVPPGTYTVVAWHEKYPQGLTQSVTVGASEKKEQNFSFTGDQLKAESIEGGALRAVPALEFPMLGMDMNH
ncbi:MAG TPA: carboxypeptidase regulatory-like domain-containing protein [Pyrinomonadaceae bacterium]|nr:carboxypeptidase regulatory-like domain-containing protein [Pyrinomonadaceae bacterium]